MREENSDLREQLKDKEIEIDYLKMMSSESDSLAGGYLLQPSHQHPHSAG